MYARRFAIALATGRRKTTVNTAKKIAKLMSWTTAVPSIARNDTFLMHQRRYDLRDPRHDQEDVERECDRDERHRFKNADA